MEAIAEHIRSGVYDFVFLQEVWSKSDYFMIADRVKSVLPYSHFYDSGVLGSGLCFFSSVNIVDVFYHRFTLNGYIHRLHQSDW